MPELVKGYYSTRDDKGRVIKCVEQELYQGDLEEAVRKFPDEWSTKPLKVVEPDTKPAGKK